MFLIIIFIIIIFIIIYIIYNSVYKYDNLIKIQSSIDKDYYWVRDKYDKINRIFTKKHK